MTVAPGGGDRSRKRRRRRTRGIGGVKVMIKRERFSYSVESVCVMAPPVMEGFSLYSLKTKGGVTSRHV